MNLKCLFKRCNRPSERELGDFLERLTDTPIHHGEPVVVFVNINGKTWQRHYTADDFFGCVHLIEQQPPKLP